MSELVIVVAVLLALAVGGLLNRRWAAGHPSEGLGIGDLVNPLATIAAVLLAFVMVEALASYDRARERSIEEAAIVEREAESADRVADAGLALEFEASLVCYARAVRFLEWPDMVTGGDRFEGVDVWSTEFERIIHAIQQRGGDAELDRLIGTDDERSDARLARLAEADPTIPIGLSALMLASVFFSVIGLATFVDPRNGARANAAVMLVFGLVVGGALIIIADLDRPFDGIERITPIAMERAQREIEAHVAAEHPSAVYPCDAQGVPTATG